MNESNNLSPLTAMILVHRDDDRLQKTLASLAWVGEIIVGDHQSQIDWSELSSQFPQLKLVPISPPKINFAEIRNQLISQARFNWILSIDSDEVVSDPLATEIKQAIVSNRYQGYKLKRRDFFFGQPIKWGEVNNASFLRLGQKENFKFSRPIHETGQVTGRIGQLKTELLHYPHQSITEFWQKICYYALLEAEHRLSQQQKFQLWPMFVFPIGKFLANYILKFGFLDGLRGFTYALMMSLHSFLVRVYWYELNQTQQNT